MVCFTWWAGQALRLETCDATIALANTFFACPHALAVADISGTVVGHSTASVCCLAGVVTEWVRGKQLAKF